MNPENGDGKLPDDFQQPAYELTVEGGDDGAVRLIAKSIYGSFETINVFPMNPVSAAILAHLLLKQALISTNALEQEGEDDDED